MTIPPLQQVGTDAWASLGKLGSNNGVIETPAGVMLVDVPHKPTDAVALAELVRPHGEVRRIVHTDHHIDHTLTNGFFEGTVIAHEVTGRRLAEDMPTASFVDTLLETLDPDGRALMAAHPERRPTVLFSERLELDLGGTVVRLLSLPGHTPNTIGVHLPESGVLFSGDTVCEMGLPSFQESSFRAWRSSIDLVLSLEFDTLVPGHGVVGDRSTAERFRQQIDSLVGEVDAARRSGMEMDEASERIRFEDLIHVTTSAYTGYPASMIEEFQRRSIRSIYEELGGACGVQPVHDGERS